MDLEDFGDSGMMGQAVLDGADAGTVKGTVARAGAVGDTMAAPEG
jgi:hypothetical protein